MLLVFYLCYFGFHDQKAKTLLLQNAPKTGDFAEFVTKSAEPEQSVQVRLSF